MAVILLKAPDSPQEFPFSRFILGFCRQHKIETVFVPFYICRVVIMATFTFSFIKPVSVKTKIVTYLDAPETHLGDDRKFLHTIPVWLIDVS